MVSMGFFTKFKIELFIQEECFPIGKGDLLLLLIFEDGDGEFPCLGIEISLIVEIRLHLVCGGDNVSFHGCEHTRMIFKYKNYFKFF